MVSTIMLEYIDSLKGLKYEYMGSLNLLNRMGSLRRLKAVLPEGSEILVPLLVPRWNSSTLESRKIFWGASVCGRSKIGL
jgi:hypothetical protein